MGGMPQPGGMEGGRRRKKTAWMAHVKATMRAHPGKKLKEVLKIAGKSYKKGMRGGNVDGQSVAADIRPAAYGATGGRRSRRTRRSRRSRRGGNLE
jgi:hypothetical protein